MKTDDHTLSLRRILAKAELSVAAGERLVLSYRRSYDEFQAAALAVDLSDPISVQRLVNSVGAYRKAGSALDASNASDAVVRALRQILGA